MGFVSRKQVRRPKKVGRPPKPIPEKLVRILDETFTGNSAYEDDITNMTPSDLQEVIRLGTLHATRRGLSFRHRINPGTDGTQTLSMWLCPKQKYATRRKKAA
jgi:hypothetical protein